MRFEEALKAMREGKIVKDSCNVSYKIDNDKMWYFDGYCWKDTYDDTDLLITTRDLLSEKWEVKENNNGR